MKRPDKCKLPVLCAAVLAVLLAVWGYRFVFPVSHTEKTDYSGWNTHQYDGEASVRQYIQRADLLLDATVLHVGREVLDAGYLRETDWYYVFHARKLTLWVHDSYAEDCGRIAEVYVQGYLLNEEPAPVKGDRILLFAERNTNPLNGKKYFRSFDGEKGIFIINPSDNTLFSLSGEDVFTAYDGTSLDEMRQTIEELLDSP